jgi:hypothetical protein
MNGLSDRAALPLRMLLLRLLLEETLVSPSKGFEEEEGVPPAAGGSDAVAATGDMKGLLSFSPPRSDSVSSWSWASALTCLKHLVVVCMNGLFSV